MRESYLYAPVKRFLTRQGYTVKGEVEGCDLVARRDDELIIVELKRSMNLTLLLQGIDRQRMTDNVYLAVEAPSNPRARRWQEVIRLCRLLGLGLLTVTRRSRGDWVQLVCEPGPYQPQKSTKRRHRIIQEFDARSGDYNVGGSTRLPLITAYREEALRIARFLKERGPSPLKEIRTAVDGSKTNSILQRDVYGWFTRVQRGVYTLSPKGEEALKQFGNVDPDSQMD